MSTLKVYTASAGAGKTHTLTREYLALILSQDGSYRRVQAVTFTNKATEEMKERIVRELYLISREPLDAPRRCSAFFDEMMVLTQLGDVALKARAREVLRSLLQDYSSFRISTIDSFFQEIIRSFVYELGLKGGYRLELELEGLLDDAITRVLADQDELKDGAEAKRWLKDLAHDLMERGKGHDLTKALRTLSRSIITEEVQTLSQQGKIPDRKSLRTLRADLREMIADYGHESKARIDELRSLLDRDGVSITDLYKTKNGPFGFIYRDEDEGQLIERAYDAIKKNGCAMSKTFYEFCDNPPKFYSSTAKNKISDEAKVLELLRAYRDFQAKSGTKMVTAHIILRHLAAFGMISDIDAKVHELQSASGAMLLSDTPSLINRIVSESDGVNFLYEKIGTRIDHQMIDEFQDTSRMQYSNFIPLLRESLDQGHSNLIVGDVKQSIYRWRGSDSTLLGSTLAQEFAEVEPITLSENWRSVPEIVHFNNQIFPSIAQSLTKHYIDLLDERVASNDFIRENYIELSSHANLIARNYRDAEQSVPECRSDRHGGVYIHRYALNAEALFIEAEDIDDESVDQEKGINERMHRLEQEELYYQLSRTIIDLQRRGYKPSDIAILVRDGREATAVADILEFTSQDEDLTDGGRYSLAFISDDALLLERSLSVRFIIAILAYINRPTNLMARLELEELYAQITHSPRGEVSDSSFSAVAEASRRGLIESIETAISHYKAYFPHGEYAYLIKLLDLALAFQQDLSVDLSDFLDMWAERKDKIKLQIPEDERKIHLMTIHKSKGLGFPVVLMPYVLWDNYSYRHKPIIWCHNPFPGQSEAIPKLPIEFGRSLLNSDFAQEFISESVAQALDSLNLLYVATTRAKNELHIWMPDSGRSATDKYNSVMRYDKEIGLPMKICLLLEEALGNSNLYIEISPSETLPDSLYHPYHGSASEIEEEGERIDTLESYDLGKRLEVLHKGLDHFEEQRQTQRTYGTLMHHILSGIERIEQAEQALGEAIREGMIPQSKEAEAMQVLEHLLSAPEASPWFDGSGRVLSEIPIIGGGSDSTHRPDRVLIYPDNSAVVVDYKFGEPRKYHQKQVREYCDLLRRMGYAPVKGYVWYLATGKITPIE